MIEIDSWVWVASGLGLIFLEVLTPGFYFLWIGLAGVITGVISYFFPQLDFVFLGTIFAVMSVIFCYFGRVSLYKKVNSDNASTLNRRGEQHIGEVVVLEEAIVNGKGKAKVGDTVWTVLSKEDRKKGETVKITGVDGISFIVE